MKTATWPCSLALALTLGMALATEAHAAEAPDSTMFGRMAALVGDWEGTFEWSPRKASGTINASYYLTGNGSALVENLISDGKPSMTSIYHMDGRDLRMTHYCAARNQPRLKASAVDLAKGTVAFAFVDATNVGPSNPGHVQACDLQILDADRIHIRFAFGGGASQAIEDISLRRVKRAEG